MILLEASIHKIKNAVYLPANCRSVRMHNGMPGKYRRKDHYYSEAKEHGYRSRASYKLVEAQKKYKLIKPGMKVLDLGCWPGGWLQVASQYAGEKGIVVGVDVVKTEYLPESNVITLQGDAASQETLQQCLHASSGLFDVVLSDLAPKLTGIREADEQATLECGNMALAACRMCLARGGSAVIKMFKNGGADQYVKQVQKMFVKVSRAELDASRRTSNEFYIICSSYKDS